MTDTTKNARDVLLELVEACEAEFCCPQTEAMEPDDSKVSYPEDRCHITFGVIRRARAALSEKEQDGQVPIDRIIQAARELDEELDGPPIAHKLRAAIDEYEESFRNCMHVAEVVGNEEVRHLHWSPGVNTLDFPVGTKLYATPAAGAVLSEKEQAGQVAWDGWAVQYPGKLPKLYGAREIAELNYCPDEGAVLLHLYTAPAAGAVPDGVLRRARDLFDQDREYARERGDNHHAGRCTKDIAAIDAAMLAASKGGE